MRRAATCTPEQATPPCVPGLRSSSALAPERAAAIGSSGSSGWGGLVGACLLLVLVLLGPRLVPAYRAGDWLHLAVPIGGLTLALLALGALWRRLNQHPLYDLNLVQENSAARPRTSNCAWSSS